MTSKLTTVAVVCIVSILLAGMMGHAWAPQVPQLRPAPATPAPSTTVVFGNDVGFRVDQWQGNTPLGTLVIKVKGEWVPVKESMALHPLTSR
jgi:hypothetical protein